MKTFVRQEVLLDLSDLGSALTRLDERSVQQADSILIYLNGPQWMTASAGGLPLDAAIDVASVFRISRRLYGETHCLLCSSLPHFGRSLCGNGKVPGQGGSDSNSV